MEEIKPISEANTFTQEEFYSYALYIEQERGYKKYWSQRIFKNCFGRNPNKKQMATCEPSIDMPPYEFYQLVDNHIELWYQQNMKGTKKDKRKVEQSNPPLTKDQKQQLDEVMKKLLKTDKN